MTPPEFQRSTPDAPAFNAGATGSAGAAVPAPAFATPLAALLTRHILQDGELVLLIVKPSVMSIILDMLKFAAIVVICMIAGAIYDDILPSEPRTYIEVGAVVLTGRLMWSILSWISRLYVLTNMRVIAIEGVFLLEIFDCPLRKVARTRILTTVRERVTRLGSIEIIPSDEQFPISLWHSVAQPAAVNEQIIAEVSRSKNRSAGICP